MAELVGIDVPIARLQYAFANQLWTNVATRAFYARAFRNLDNQGNEVAELFVAENDYMEVMFDDKFDVQCFFDPSNTTDNLNADQQASRECAIIFVCKADVVYPLELGRVTEQLYRDVLEVIYNTSPLSIIPQDIVSGLPAYGDLNTDKLKAYDMQPWHVFRINTLMRIEYGCTELVSGVGGYEYPFPILFTG